MEIDKEDYRQFLQEEAERLEEKKALFLRRAEEFEKKRMLAMKRASSIDRHLEEVRVEMEKLVKGELDAYLGGEKTR